MKYFFLTFLLISATLLTVSAQAADDQQNFDQWIINIKDTAIRQGISQQTINDAFRNIRYDEEVVRLDRKQPEGTITFTKYRGNILSPQRIQKGRQMMREHHNLLTATSKIYGVAPQYIVALWGIETNFGGYTGNKSTIGSLATLAYDGRRAKFFTKELLNALKIIDAGHISAAEMQGSWAGAMGQNQFMPSSFLSYAVDGNNDGKTDIWGTLSDVFASSSNYLRQNGWKIGERWGRAVKLNKDLDPQYMDLAYKAPLSWWAAQGIRQYDGTALPDVDIEASLIELDQQYFLVYNNYRVLMHWNKSRYFATSVGLLADAISY